MSRIYLLIAGLFVAAGLAASFFAPTESMGAREAFYAHLILIAPPLFIGTVISALAMIIHRLDQLLEKDGRINAPQKLGRAPEQTEDFGSLFAEKLRSEQAAPASLSTEPEMPFQFETLEIEEEVSAPEPELKSGLQPQPFMPANDWRAPTVDEYLEKGSDDGQPPSARLAREGTFAGRSYRMYEDGSLEVDTDQSTIRFDSLEEFRGFVSSAAKG
jgi:hypothetical protein